ncbi:hypothetical protein [Mucilaginibacter gotjawali]|uniref:Uncharacterized protein n=2 Tax=Mucilaginibacter gotjawali TaxID=1550579 RepID=A0A110AZC3_9SPHI|nr:hypothetical protein [Mucilaginibacter gotjawali]MBB3053750.1 putative chitinase [Mucilaginibacter gotjawali]BAU54010.1 hypothetical protein MgSA37_02181 [Mucilaginibacter gotjawali]
MAIYVVTVDKLNRRSVIPSKMPDTNNIVGVVNKGYKFNGHEVDPDEIPNYTLGKWYRGTDGSFYWGGGVSLVQADVKKTLLDLNQIVIVTGATLAIAQLFLQYINHACARYQINTPVRQLCFLIQLGHDSDGLFYTEEVATGHGYEEDKHLGNTHKHDGVTYKGRGLLKIVGRRAYEELENEFDKNFVLKPTILGGKNATLCESEQLKYAALSAGWLWDKKELNKLADKIDIKKPIDEETNLKHFEAITYKIAGSYQGLSDQIKKFNAGLQYFK